MLADELRQIAFDVRKAQAQLDANWAKRIVDGLIVEFKAAANDGHMEFIWRPEPRRALKDSEVGALFWAARVRGIWCRRYCGSTDTVIFSWKKEEAQ